MTKAIILIVAALFWTILVWRSAKRPSFWQKVDKDLQYDSIDSYLKRNPIPKRQRRPNPPRPRPNPRPHLKNYLCEEVWQPYRMVEVSIKLSEQGGVHKNVLLLGAKYPNVYRAHSQNAKLWRCSANLLLEDGETFVHKNVVHIRDLTRGERNKWLNNQGLKGVAFTDLSELDALEDFLYPDRHLEIKVGNSDVVFLQYKDWLSRRGHYEDKLNDSFEKRQSFRTWAIGDWQLSDQIDNFTLDGSKVQAHPIVPKKQDAAKGWWFYTRQGDRFVSEERGESLTISQFQQRFAFFTKISASNPLTDEEAAWIDEKVNHLRESLWIEDGVAFLESSKEFQAVKVEEKMEVTV